ncbi:MAG: SGNH/GDSL hydrolase family protein [Aureliella sp.]
MSLGIQPPPLWLLLVFPIVAIFILQPEGTLMTPNSSFNRFVTRYSAAIATAVLVCLATSSPAAAQGAASGETPDAAKIVQQASEAATKKWEENIQKLEQLDKTEVHADGSILFVGSSSIRRWDTMQQDMQPWSTIRRGYGGAKFTDLALFIERLIANHQYRALVIFVANDIVGKESDRTPEEVLALFKYVTEKALAKKPGKPIFYIEITPTSSRFAAWDAISRGNELIRKYCEETPGLHFIQTAKRYLTPSGRPKDYLFVEDRLHLNAKGYKLWADIIAKHLEQVLGTDR